MFFQSDLGQGFFVIKLQDLETNHESHFLKKVKELVSCICRYTAYCAVSFQWIIMNIVSLSLHSIALIRTYSEICLFLQEGEYLRPYFILSTYSSFRYVRHSSRWFLQTPRWVNEHNTKAAWKEMKRWVLVCFHVKYYAKEIFIYIQQNNMILSQNADSYCLLMVIVKLTASSDWKMPDSQCKSEWEVEWELLLH